MVGIRMAMVPTQMAKRLLCTFHYVQMQQEVVTYNLESSPLLDPWPLPSPQDHNAIWCFASYSVYSVLLQQPKQDKMTMCLSCWLWYPFLCDYVTASAGILWVNRKPSEFWILASGNAPWITWFDHWRNRFLLHSTEYSKPELFPESIKSVCVWWYLQRA